MKTKSVLLSGAAIACLISSSTILAEDTTKPVELYGKLFVSLDKINEENGDNQWELNSNASRFGIKGSTKSEGIETFYQVEWEVDVADNSASSADHIKARNQIVGVRGKFGEVFAGRHDTPTKKLQNKIDLFNDLSGDLKTTFNGEVRADNIVQYTTPSLGNIKIKTALIPGEQTGVSDGIADGTSVSVEYKSGDLFVGMSSDSDVEGIGIETSRFVAQYKIDDLQLGLMFQDTDNNGISADGMMASAKYSLGDNAIKLQISESDLWETLVSGKVQYTSQTSLGWDSKITNNSTFFMYYTTGEDGFTGEKDKVFGIGLIQKF